VESCLVITNEGAGTADEDSLRSAVDLLSEHTSVEVVTTSKPGELDSVLHRAGSRRIVVAGGDGSLHAVVTALHRRQDLASSVLGLLPLGTGNDFARAMDIPLDPEEAARLLVTGEVRAVDMLVDERGGVVVNNVHVGAGAQASRRGDRWKQRLGRVGYKKVNLGRLGYPIGALLAAVKPPQLRLRIEVDGTVVCDVDQPVLMVAVGNGTSVGGGTELTPEADPEDGKADVMISRSVGPLAKLGYAAHLARSRHHDRDDVHYLRAREVTVSGEDFWCAADGEISGPERRRSWRVVPAAYSMVLPS
jgi:YegS/Rv2252/BmrU family lipid kinase